MVEKLLETATLDSESLKLNKEDVDIVALLSSLSNRYQTHNTQKTITTDIKTKSLITKVDIFHFENALNNILDNAIKYTPEKGKIHIRSYREKCLWHIEISDNGPGIPEKEHEKVVQRFYRLDQSRTTPGSGLGLALVFAVLKLHKLDLKFLNNKPGLKVRVTCSQQLAVNNRKPTHNNANDNIEETSLMV